MVIEKQNYQNILKNLKLGNPVAEYDDILQEARVNTPIFQEFLAGDYDIVVGRKGAGKTAIFRIVGDELKDAMLIRSNKVILTGVSSSGDTIFGQFKNSFEYYSEDDFENFWKIYLISLIYNDFLKNPDFEDYLKDCNKEIEVFKRTCSKAGIPNIPSRMTRHDIIASIVRILPTKKVKRAQGQAGIDPNTGVMGATLTFDFFDKNAPDIRAAVTSVYVNDIGVAFKGILDSCGLNMWIMLDRLDEVFDRYSKVEFNGLRGLLKAYRSFDLGNPRQFSIKLFLRDDIKEFLTDDKIFKKYFKGSIPPFAAASHIFAKSSPLLSWSMDEIEMLILNRLLVSGELRQYLGMTATNRDEIEKLLQTKEQRQVYWAKIFPEKINNMPSLSWIYTRLQDSNEIITPRTVIDLLTAAVSFQRQILQINFEDSALIFPENALKHGHVIASKNKLVNEIYNEFPRTQGDIKKLIDGKGKLNKSELIKLYGDRWEDVVETLRLIGLFRLVPHSNDYMVEFLYRPALGIRL
ncbi:MAG: hypothetical protein Q8T08_17170 [Ignavibacteria bacterium]|nr:hypothetical protein [Ignavibacteria bacterium]